jgi:SulP family sulfate permease
MFDRHTFGADLSAALTVAMVSLPLNLALAVACGLPPHAGLLSAAAAGIVGALIGGSRYQITGPEVALAPMTLAIVTDHGLGGLIAVTAMAGLLQLGMGFLRVGRVVGSIPRPVVGGFLAAVGLLVFDSQVPRLLGLDGVATIGSIGDLSGLGVNLSALGVGALVIVTLVVLRRFPRIPAPLVGLGAAVIVTASLDLSVARIEPLEGASLLPTLPAFGELDFLALLPSAIALALLASLDSLLCAVSIDQRTGERHNSDQELVAQGFANIASAFVGGMPVAAAVVRSVVAVESRAATRLAGLLQSFFLLAVVLVLGAHLDHIPLAALAGVLLVVGARLIHVGELRAIARIGRFEAVVFVATALAIVFFDFVPGVIFGVGLSLVALAQGERNALNVRAVRELPDTRIVELEGALFSASQDRLRGLVDPHLGGAAYVVLDLRGLHVLDASGIAALRTCVEKIRKRGAAVGVGGVPSARLMMLTRELEGSGALVRHSADAAAQALIADGAWSAEPTDRLPPVAQPIHTVAEQSAAPAE